MNQTTDNVLSTLREMGNSEYLSGMSRFGINTQHALGIRIPDLRKYAKQLRRNHVIALDLWQTGVHEARILASLIDEPASVTLDQMEKWVKDFDSWDLCDQTCGNLFVFTPYAFQKAVQWSTQPEEFVKRAGFVMMAALAVHRKDASNNAFLPFFTLIEQEAYDGRNFVKKAASWALRQIGKRNAVLHHSSMNLAGRLLKQSTKSARWIGSDTLKELTNDKVMGTLPVN